MEPPPLLYQKSVWPVDRFRHYGGLQRTQTSVADEKPLPEQCGAARSPLDWTRERLAASAGVEETGRTRSEEHTSELQSLMRNSYAVFCLKKKKKKNRATLHYYR